MTTAARLAAAHVARPTPMGRFTACMDACIRADDEAQVRRHGAAQAIVGASSRDAAVRRASLALSWGADPTAVALALGAWLALAEATS